jgi:hypothetical protein
MHTRVQLHPQILKFVDVGPQKPRIIWLTTFSNALHAESDRWTHHQIFVMSPAIAKDQQ